MAKVQFNCRLDEPVAKWIAEEADRQTVTRETRFSQADVVALLVNEEQTAREVSAATYTPEIEKRIAAQVRPRKRSKKEQAIEERAASDITAQSVGREDIDYSDVESTPMTHVTTLDAVGPAVSSGQGKATIERWRANRKPLLKPGDRK